MPAYSQNFGSLHDILDQEEEEKKSMFKINPFTGKPKYIKPGNWKPHFD